MFKTGCVSNLYFIKSIYIHRAQIKNIFAIDNGRCDEKLNIFFYYKFV